jgi:hypothetical protein
VSYLFTDESYYAQDGLTAMKLAEQYEETEVVAALLSAALKDACHELKGH